MSGFQSRSQNRFGKRRVGRATRAAGAFDLHTFALRAYPIEKIDGLRPGMSIYTDWARRSP